MTEISLTYGELLNLLADMNRIAPSGMVAFKGRLQHFQRLKFPPGVNTGKGRPAKYGLKQIFLMALAIELTQFGVNPERVVAVMALHPVFVDSIGLHIRLGSGGHYLVFAPRALSALQDDSQMESRRVDLISHETAVDLARQVESSALSELVGLVNVRALLTRIEEGLDKAGSISSDEDRALFWSEIKNWSASRHSRGPSRFPTADSEAPSSDPQ